MPSSVKRPERNPVLGVEFGHDQIRAVEVRREGAELIVTAAGSAPMPTGAFEPGSTVSHEVIGHRLRALTRKIGASTRHAVLGVPSAGVFTRLLDLPLLPDEELEPVVAGEVAHYQMVRQDGGAFAFAKIAAPEGSRELPVVVMAADDPVLHKLDEVARVAGLAVVAKEPTQLASVRAAVPARTEEPTLLVSISDTASEIAILDGGRLALYRRIDVGGQQLLSSPQAAALAGGAEVPAAFSPTGPLPVDEVLAARLATEIRRSIDFYRRQFPASDVSQAVLAPMNKRLESLSAYLGASLGMECRVATPSVGASGAAAAELGLPISPEYLGAIGLAAGELGYVRDALPRLDLVPSKPLVRKGSFDSARYAYSAVASLVVVGLGLFAWNSARAAANQSERTIAQLEQENRLLEAEIAPKQQRRNMEYEVLAELSRQGVPFPWVMDQVSASLDSGVGIQEIRFDSGRIQIEGEAKDEAALIATLDRMRTQGSFQAPVVDSFQNTDGRGLKFNLSSAFLTSRPAPTPPPAAAPVTGMVPEDGGPQ